MSDFIEEIKEDVKIERFINFIKLYSNYIIAIILIVLIGTGGYLFWESRVEKVRLQEAATFEQAQRVASEGKTADALKILGSLESQVSQGSPQGYKVLALFQQALLDSVPSSEKSKIYLDIANDGKIESKFRELAVILWGYENIDQEDLTALQRKISPLADGKSPWRDSANELLALIDIRAGNTKNALQRLKYLISNEDTTPGIRRRALALFEQVGG
ncbi:MAG: hypothetical protein ACRYGR_10265 [Janthinobacterium lividum]